MKSELLPLLVRAYRKILIEADAKHSPPSVITLVIDSDKEREVVLSQAAIKLAIKVAQTAAPECIHALKLALCAHYDPDLTMAHITVLLNDAINDDVLEVAEAAKIPLIIDPYGRVWTAMNALSAHHARDGWHVSSDDESVLVRDLAEVVRVAAHYRATGELPDTNAP